MEIDNKIKDILSKMARGMIQATAKPNHCLIDDLKARYNNNGLAKVDTRIISGFSNPLWWYMVLSKDNIIDYLQTEDPSSTNYCVRNKRDADIDKIVDDVFDRYEHRLKAVYLDNPFYSSPR